MFSCLIVILMIFQIFFPLSSTFRLKFENFISSCTYFIKVNRPKATCHAATAKLSQKVYACKIISSFSVNKYRLFALSRYTATNLLMKILNSYFVEIDKNYTQTNVIGRVLTFHQCFRYFSSFH